MWDIYPYKNLTDLNLDFILKAIGEMENQVKNFVALNAIKYAEPIQWDITRSYEKNTVVIDGHSGIAYISVAPVPSGVSLTRPEYWTVVFDLSTFITKGAANFANHYESQPTPTATMNTNEGEWVVWDSTLFEALTDIHAGDAYVVGGNIKKMTVEDFYKSLITVIQSEAQTRTDEDARIELELTGLINSKVEIEGQTRADEDVRIELELTNLINSRIDVEAQTRQAQIDYLSDVRYLFNNVNDMKAADYLKIGDTVYCAGYYAAGDGGSGTFKIAIAAIGFSHLLDNGLYATNIDDDFLLPRYGGYYVNVMLDNARPFMMPHQYKHIILPQPNDKHPGCGTYNDTDGAHYFWQVDAPIVYDENLAYSVNDFYGEISLTPTTTNREAIIKVSDSRKPEDITFTGKLQLGGYHYNGVMNYAQNGILVEGCGRLHFNDCLIAWCVNCLTMGGAGSMNPYEVYFHFLEVGSCTNAGIIASSTETTIFNVDYLRFQNALPECKYCIYANCVPFNWYIGDIQCVATGNAEEFVPIRIVMNSLIDYEHALYIGSARLQAQNSLGVMVGVYGQKGNVYIGNLVCNALGAGTARIVNSSAGQLIIDNLDCRQYPFILQTDPATPSIISANNVVGGTGTLIGAVKLNGITTNATNFNSALVLNTNTGEITAKFNGTQY